MTAQRNFTRTDLGHGSSVYLEVETQPSGKWVRFPVTQVSITWANNEIPEATCLLAVGRRIDSLGALELSETHRSADQLIQSRKARIMFQPKGTASPRTPKLWPDRLVSIFDGYLSGNAPQRSSGQTQIGVTLTHNLVDLTRSSIISAQSHPSNPFSLVEPAAFLSADNKGGLSTSQIGGLTGVARQTMLEDWWTTVKSIMWFLASQTIGPFGNKSTCGSAVPVKNDRALRALARIESGESVIRTTRGDPGTPPLFPEQRKHSRPLAFRTRNVPLVGSAVTKSILDDVVSSFAETTMWDKLVGRLMPQFGVAISPNCENAIVFADTPTARITNPWRTVYPDEFISLNLQSNTFNPLAGIAVHGQLFSQTGAHVSDNTVTPLSIAGCYYTGDADGVIRVVGPPSWLQDLQASPRSADESLRVLKAMPAVSMFNPLLSAIGGEFTNLVRTNTVRDLYDNYARFLFVADQLRGRIGTLTGRLRFDIAPGSMIRIESVGDVFSTRNILNSEVTAYFACVSRVTTSINAENMTASTSFQLTHIRSEEENTDDAQGSPIKRSLSTPDHPLFGTDFHGGGKHGSPLLSDYP